MTLTDDPQKLLELRQFYLTQVDQLYQQIQKWGTGKMEFAFTDNCPIDDKTGEYQAQVLTVNPIKQSQAVSNGTVDFWPWGITFLTEEGILKSHGAFNEEELVYMQTDKLTYTERNGQVIPLDEGFEQDGWYWMFGKLGETKMRQLTEPVFWELIRKCTGYSTEELP